MNIEDMEYDSENETDSEVDSDVEPENMKRLIQQKNDGNGTSERMFHSLPSLQNTTINCESSAEQAQLLLALSENKILEETLIKLERIMTIRLNECRSRLKEIQSSDSLRNEKTENFRYISCGRPYFKDKQNFPAPDNDDAKMAKTQMYDFSMVKSAPGWTVKDKSQLVSVIHKMSIDIKKNELFAKIETLKRNTNSIKKEGEIMDIRKEIDEVSKLPLSKVALPIDQEYDWDIAANKLNGRHTAKEYQALWKLFLHPTINKNTWSKAEHAKLTQIACEHHMQDWDAIAHKLNIGRTGYQCFVYHKTNMNNPHTGKKWTDEEEIYLTRLIAHFKEGTFIPWGKIAAAMENRTKAQVYNKYTRLIEQRKGRFLPEEDAVILNCVQGFGTNFRRMVNYLPGRSMSQIRARHQVLSKLRVSTVWSVEDDKKLIQLMGHQESNMNFSTATQYFPGRNRTKIRTRYITLMKWMKKHPNLDLEHAPRRGARRLNHGRPSENLDEALENLKNSLVTTAQTKAKKMRLTEDSAHTDIDDAIAVYFVNFLTKETEAESKESAPDNHLVLGPDHIVSKSDLNVTNLRKNIIFLNASLNESTYLKSKYYLDYPTLGDNTQDVPLVKLKSYSRKNSSLTPILVRGTPNVWGKPALFEGTQRMCQRKYVFPPQLFTITGIKAIMEYVEENCQYSGSINVHVLCRRNAFLKEQLDKVQERFYVLFTWPMILTNEPPKKSTVSGTPRTETVFIRPPILPTVPEVTINVKCYKKFKNVDISENIDLNEREAKKPKIAVEENIGDTSGEKIENIFCD